MVKKRPKKRGCLPPIIRLALFFLFFFSIGLFVFYSIDNPNFMPGLRDRFSPEESQPLAERLKEEDLSQETFTIQVEEPVEAEEKGTGLLERLKGLLGREEAEAKPELSPRLGIDLYFATLGEDMLLASEQRTIVAGNRDTALYHAAKELLRGPTRSYLFPVIPGGTSLIDCGIQENIASINLSQEFLDKSLDTRILDDLIIYSMVNTVTGIPGIDGVVFYIDGKRIKVYGNIDLSIPAIRNEEIIRAEE